MFFPVGSKVECLEVFGGSFIKGATYEVANPARYKFGIPEPDKFVYVVTEAGWVAGMHPHRFKLVAERTSRANDPTTSKGKRKVNKYEQAVLQYLCLGCRATGKEIAAAIQMPLNCITPRFAPLRRKGLIKDSGIKRDKQIVWVLA